MGFHYRINNNKRTYFFTLSVVEQADIFVEEKYIFCIIESLRFCQEKKGLRIFGWCLMPNALYIIAQAEEGRELSKIVRDLKTYTSKTLAKLALNHSCERSKMLLRSFKKAAVKSRKKIDFKVWQEGYHPVELFCPGFATQKLFEIHGFPIEKGLAYEKTDYKFSSARNYSNMPALLSVENISEPISKM